MPRAHRDNCPFMRTGLYYPPAPEQQYALGTDKNRDLLFHELSAALGAIDSPLGKAVADLTADELTVALQSLPIARRADVLHPLGLPLAPVKVGRALAQNVRDRLLRAPEHDRLHACAALTNLLVPRVLAAALAAGHPNEVEITRKFLSGLSPTILRVAVWSNTQATARGARVWVWAANQPWFVPDGIDPASVEHLVAAARALISVTPDLDDVVGDATKDSTTDDTPGDGTTTECTSGDGGPREGAAVQRVRDASSDNDSAESGATAKGPGADEADRAGSEAGVDIAVGALAHQSFPARPDPFTEQTQPTVPATTEPPQASTEGRDHDPLPALTQDLERLEVQVVTASRFAEALVEELVAGRPPQPEQLLELTSLSADFSALGTAFLDAGVEVAEVSISGLRDALVHVQRQSLDVPLRDELSQFGLLTAPPALPLLRDQLANAAGIATALLDISTWTAAQRGQAQALALLISLTDPDLPLVEKVGVQQQVVEADPTLALLAIQAGALVFAPHGVEAPAPPAPPQRSQESEKHPEQPFEDADGSADPLPVSTVETGPPANDSVDAETLPDGPTAQESPTDESAPADAPAATREVPVPSNAEVGTEHPLGDLVEHAVSEPASSQQTAPQLDEPDLAPVWGELARLVGESRYALAAEFVRCCGPTTPDPDVLTTSALAAAVRAPNGGVASAIKAKLPNLDAAALTDTASLLLIVPALLRTALVTGDYAAGALLLDVQPHLEQHLGTLAHEVGKRAVEGALVHSPPLTRVSDTASSEQAIAAATDDATHQTRDRTLRYKRATDIANDWLSAGGLIGRALRVVAADARAERAVVDEALTLLTDPSAVSRQIEVEDRQRRGSSSKALQGPAVGNLMSIAAEALNPLSRWTAAVDAEAGSDRRTSWSTAEVSQMRTAVQAAGPTAIEALRLTARDDADAVVAAAAGAAAESLDETLALLGGVKNLDAIELSVANVLGLDLLHVAGVLVDETSGDISLPPARDAANFAAAAVRTWEDSVRLHVAEENFPAARRIVRAAQSLILSGPDGTAALSAQVIDLVSNREGSAASEVNQLRVNLEGALRNARLNNQISEEQDAELTAQLRSAERTSTDPGAVRAILDGITKKLPHYQKEAAERLRVKLDEVHGDGRASTDDVARVTGFIDHGDLGTAEELVYLLQNDDTLPSMRPHDELQHFYPVVPDSLPHGITSTLVKAVRDRQALSTCPVLDYSGVSSNDTELNVIALKGWVRLGETPPEKRYQVSAYDLLVPALRVAGIELKKVDPPDAKLIKYRDRRFVDVREVTLNGHAMVPAFGSDAGDRRRILLVWGQPSAETLMSYVDQDPAQGPLIVAYFGTMTVGTRKHLAVRSLQSSAPVVVLDDAALAYLAAQGRRLFESTMRILLPFAHVNPYIRQKRGAVATEMFYGRGDERRSVLNKNGTQIVYGGRGLGKSALLHAAEAEFERSGHAGDNVAIYMSLDSLGIGASNGALGAGVLWDALLQQLNDRGVVGEKKSQRSSRAGAYDKVLFVLLAWLGEDTSRRLLILLDESDRFFEVDAPVFLETKRIRELGLRTQDRAKVVFAGLHSVQRFTKIAGNSPYSHLAQRPTVIGPLKPQHALNLLTAPLEAMGYTFSEPDLVNRVLANCSYQPFLLQMFGHRLVERMHQQRRAAPAGQAGVPYLISRADIEAVETNNELREDISNAFRETLHLDPRYNVIANVMARHAHNFGLDARLSDTEMREECLEWWRDGFASLDVEAFRAYLAELVGLGVLARNSDGQGWRLRGPAVLNMVGLPSEVETQLLGADTSSLRDEFVALETRTLMGDGATRSPLTAVQMSDLVGDHTNQVRVVLGSDATGIGAAADAVAAAADIGDRFEVIAPTSRGSFETALLGGKPGERRVVVSSLAGLDEDKCLSSLQAALTRVPDRSGVTRATVLIADADQLGFWRDVLAREASVPELSTVSLRRYDLPTLRVWALVANMFGASLERTERLLQVTGGWPFLVERAATRRASSVGEVKVMDGLETFLATPVGAAELVAAVGVGSDACVARVYTDLVEMLTDDAADDADLADLQSVAADSGGDPETVVACLLSLGVLTASSNGRYRPEPVLAAAWRRR